MFRQAISLRNYATEAAASAAKSENPQKMTGLLSKLSSIVNNGSQSQKQTMIKKTGGKKSRDSNPRNKNNNNRNNNERRFSDNRQQNRRNNNNRRRNGDMKVSRNDKREQRGITRTFAPQTVSRYDKFQPNADQIESSKPRSTLNESGLKFASLLEARAKFILRKTDATNPKINLADGELRAIEFAQSRVNHLVDFFNKKDDKFATEFFEKYQLETVNSTELKLSGDKLSYNSSSRVLKALEVLFNKRGYKLSDLHAKNNVKYLPPTSNIYPYANTLLPNNLDRPNSNLKELSNIPKEEINETISHVVKGSRPELKFNSAKEFKTEQLKINEQVIINNLNRNPQLQVDNLHKQLYVVMNGEKPLSELPKPIIAPKKL